MWHTSEGDRTLDKAEADLVSAGIDQLLDEIVMRFDDQWEADSTWTFQTGVNLFDRLEPQQQIGMLHLLAFHLLSPSVPPSLSAESEATVAAVFAEVKDQLLIEVDLDQHETEPSAGNSPDDPHRWRRMTRSAYIQTLDRDGLLEDAELIEGIGSINDRQNVDGGELHFRVPPMDSTERGAWLQLIDSLTDQILWDRDYELADLFLDADPQLHQIRRGLLGIESDYFVGIAPDPPSKEVPKLVSATRALVRRKPR